ncbi:MAG: rotamase [Alphaproteobacteria bacterium]|nr:rotamase [Alphaproteobacteria bacterium]
MTHNIRAKESGNAVIIVLVALVVIAIGAMAYFSGHLASADRAENTEVAEATTGEPVDSADEAYMADAQDADAQNAQPETEIKPGNPVVAKVGDKEIKRLDVFQFMQTMPAQTRQMPMDQLFPLVQNQIVNMSLVKEQATKANLDNDPLVKQQLEAAKANIVPVVYLQREVEKAITEDRLKEAYDQYVANFPEVEEVKAAHILVDDKKLADDLVKQLDDGADFAALAKEYSKDSTAKDGGELGYFLKNDVVPEFGDAAYSQEIGVYSAEPVKSEFGYHIIKVEERRPRPPADFAEAKPFLEGQLRNTVTNEVVEKLREKAGVEIFDINGDAIEPASGDEAEADAPAKEKVPAEKAAE